VRRRPRRPGRETRLVQFRHPAACVRDGVRTSNDRAHKPDLQGSVLAATRGTSNAVASRRRRGRSCPMPAMFSRRLRRPRKPAGIRVCPSALAWAVRGSGRLGGPVLARNAHLAGLYSKWRARDQGEGPQFV